MADNLQAARRASDLSQEELAKLAGLNRNRIGMLERVELSPTLDSVDKLAMALQIVPCELL